MKNRKHDGAHDYSGSWIGWAGHKYAGQTTSVGIFQWVPAADKKRKRLKKSAVIHRVRGPIAKVNEIHSKAESICDLLDAGETLKYKTTTIK